MMVAMDGWIVFQAVAAGTVAGTAAVLYVWWRSSRKDRFVFWLTVWLVPVAVLLLLNAVIPLTEPGTPLDTFCLWLRSQALAATTLVAIPALRSITGGPRLRWWVVTVGGLFAVRAVLFLTTDLVYAHRYVDGSPHYGPLITVSFALPVLLALAYVVLGIRRMTAGAMRTAAALAVALSFGGLTAAFVIVSGPVAELLTSLWALPVVAVVIYGGVQHTRASIARSARQKHMRDAVAALTQAAWFDRDPEQLLERAGVAARALLGAQDIEGRITRTPRGAHHTSFAAPAEVTRDPQATGFLDDLGQVVSAAADRHDLSRRLRDAAEHDFLTGLPNRRRLDTYVSEQWERADVGRLAVLFCDLDAFKRVNEEFGHPTGDSVLQATARAMRETVGDAGLVARYGGDEFVVVLPDAPSDAEVVALARRLEDAVVAASPGKVRSLSVGVLVADRDEPREAHSLVRDADTAMFEAKRKGLGVRVFDAELRARVLREIDLARRITRSVAEGEFDVHFQPIVDATSLEVVAVEALSRWVDEDGAHEPREWVSAAEESGQIIEIGIGVVRAARRALELFALPVGVNVSPRQLAEPDLAARLLEAWGPGDRDKLILEITETALLDDLPLGVETLQSLRAEGVRIALDDFGTGYSTLTRLANLPVDVLKVDRALTGDVTTARGCAVLRAVVDIAHASGLEVVVEGIETVEQLEIVRDVGADRVQGFLVGRPASHAPERVRLPQAGRPRG